MCADWNQLFLDNRKIIREPDVLVREFIQLLPVSGKVFDFGCGAGRHLVFLTKSGYKAIGGDVSLNGMFYARHWLTSEGQNADLIQLSMTDLPFSDGCFDGIISINVLNHGRLEETAAAIQEAHRILKSGAPFFFILIGREDARCGDGNEIEPFTFIVRQGIEAGVPHHYFGRDEVEELAAKYSRADITERRRPYDKNDPVFGNDPYLRGRKDIFFHHWVAKCWK